MQLRARPATDEEILRVHTPEHLAHIRALAATGGDAGDGAAMGRFGDEIAVLAAGGAIVAADAILDGTVENAYALVRPPGHHAEPGRAMGFCIFSNIGIAIRHAQQVRGVGRVAVVDWDVHHGNGTETIFLSDPSVLAISLHQDEHYPPGRGRVDVVGDGEGRGTNLNIPLPPGGGIASYALRVRARRRAGAARVPARADHRRERIRRQRVRPARPHEPRRGGLPPAHRDAHGGRRRGLPADAC